MRKRRRGKRRGKRRKEEKKKMVCKVFFFAKVQINLNVDDLNLV